ncbi:hypothetical protein COBT_002541, partial [Conglomerata obtusa]
MNQKRRYYQASAKEIIVDETYLIKSYRMVTEKELSLLVNYPYKNYLVDFYKDKIKKLFTLHFNNTWFKERYLINKNNKELYTKNLDAFNLRINELGNLKLDANIEFPFYPYTQKNIFVSGELSYESRDKLLEMCSMCPGFNGMEIIISFFKHQILRNIIITLNDSTDVDGSLHFMKDMSNSLYNFEPLIFKEVFCSVSNLCLEEIDKIFIHTLVKKFAKLYQIEIIIDETKDLDYYILLLRFVFNYCYYCVVQYDSQIEMIKCCGCYHIRNNNAGDRKVFNRKNEIITQEKNFDNLRPKTTALDDTFFKNVKRDISGFLCTLCDKQFETENTIKTHLQKRHNDKIEINENFNKNYNLFLDNIDVKLLNNLEGIEDWKFPIFLHNIEKENVIKNEIVYDM